MNATKTWIKEKRKSERDVCEEIKGRGRQKRIEGK